MSKTNNKSKKDILLFFEINPMQRTITKSYDQEKIREAVKNYCTNNKIELTYVDYRERIDWSEKHYREKLEEAIAKKDKYIFTDYFTESRWDDNWIYEFENAEELLKTIIDELKFSASLEDIQEDDIDFVNEMISIIRDHDESDPLETILRNSSDIELCLRLSTNFDGFVMGNDRDEEDMVQLEKICNNFISREKLKKEWCEVSGYSTDLVIPFTISFEDLRDTEWNLQTRRKVKENSRFGFLCDMIGTCSMIETRTDKSKVIDISMYFDDEWNILEKDKTSYTHRRIYVDWYQGLDHIAGFGREFWEENHVTPVEKIINED